MKRKAIPGAGKLDSASLAAELKKSVQGEVRFDNGSRALYANDGSNYRQVPIGVVVPVGPEDVVQTVALCRKYGAPLLPRGAGTSLAGQCCNVAVVVDMSKYMHHILELDPHRAFARVQPGTVLDHLRNAAEEHHLTFAPDPATHSHNTLGGMVGNNSCGIHSVMGGKTDDNILELDILTYDGLRMRVGETSDQVYERIVKAGGRRAEIYSRIRSLRDRYGDLIRERFPKIPRAVSGYNLGHLLPEYGFNIARALVGSEGTCVTVLEAKGRLLHSPPARTLLVLGYPDVYRAADRVMEILEHGPVGLEGIDDNLAQDMRKKGLHPEYLTLLPEGKGWLLVEFGGENRHESEDKAREVMERLKGRPDSPAMKLYTDRKEEKMVWKIRESGLGATARVPGESDTWPGWEDSAVHPKDLAPYLRDLRNLLNKYGYACALYGHFGQACVHTRIDFDLLTKEGIGRYHSFVEEAADMVVGYGGSFSGEHGDGQSRAELLPRLFGPELMEAFREFKRIWDPEWKMNPGKVIDPYGNTENLRLGPGYNPPDLKTHFHFIEDKGSFPYATLRCVGVGDCRGLLSGTMCPSYMGTREEMHSTRGRARLLFEMMKGEVITDLWRDRHVHEALDLCLSCKSCKGECPVNVDMAKYKAEFYSHYYKGRIRHLDAYTMGLIYWWCRLASAVPGIANLFTQAEPFSSLFKLFGGISIRRQFPPFARESFRRWFEKRPERKNGKPPVILWPDTFNNFFYPEVMRAGMSVLEHSGYRVLIPDRPLCCGRPLYDYGMVDLAKRLLRQILDSLAPLIEEDTPLVCLEPACLATFRDELLDLYPHDLSAQRLGRKAYMLEEFLQKEASDYTPPRLRRKAVVHGHCTHKTVLKLDSEEDMLSKMGLDFELLDSGCCGISGAFGFRSGNYELSMDIGERVLLPAVRKAEKDTLIVADGFSCREQIAHATDREPLHLAQVMLMAIQDGESGPPGPYPERFYMERPRHPSLSRNGRAWTDWAFENRGWLTIAGLLIGGYVFNRARVGRGMGEPLLR
jgi:FAD/FMN-containing dehydrogenase/Fe-S oxidoreductase